MHMRRNCHRHLWLLSGTGDGPPLVKALILKGWKVSVSVVSAQAALSYSQLPVHSLSVGALEGIEAIKSFLEKAKALHDGFQWIIDATHPFAKVISSNLKTVCLDLGQPLIRFERSCKTLEEAILIQSHKDLKGFDLRGKKLLLALGARHLVEAVHCSNQSGAIVFARVLPTVQGLGRALSSDLPEDHIGVLKPSTGEFPGNHEAALCRKWGITGVVARQSGGSSQQLWQRITHEQGLDLWLIARPATTNVFPTFDNYFELCEYI